MTVHADNLNGWKWCRNKIRKGEPNLDFYCCQSTCRGLPGVYVHHFILNESPAPLGCIWYRFLANQTELDILNIYTMEPVRRCGVARKMIETIVSDAGSPLGEKWMRSMKFKRIPGKRWELHRGQR
jgi:hypothetical protein